MSATVKFRTITIYKHYFPEFFSKQRQKVKDKIIWTFKLIEELKQVPEIYLKHIEGILGLFENESDSLGRQLDLVMLTNGWRHFSWQKVLNNENYAFNHPVERSLYIAGNVDGYKDLQPGKENFKIKLLIVNHDSSKFVGYVLPDSTGKFAIKDFNQSGPSDIYTGTADRKNRQKKLLVKLYLTLDDSLKQAKAESFREPALPDLSEYYISHAQAEAKYRLAVNSIMLQTVNIKSTRQTPTEKLIEEHVNSKNRSDREFTLDLINDPAAMVNIGIIDYIRGKFPSLQIFGDNGNPQFIYRGGNSLYAFATAKDNQYLPYFYLNDAIVNYGNIYDMSLVEIALIRFMPPPVAFAPFNGGNVGAIMIYTKKQSDEVRKMTAMADFDHFIFNGFSITREFSVPDEAKLKQAGLIDDRLTLYWNHDLETDRNGVIKFSFRNSAIAKKIRIVIQGMDKDGRLVYINKDFN